MRLAKGKRRLLAALGFVIVALLLILFGIPIWLPWALKPLASGKGLTFTTYERKGYSRFALTEVTFTNADVHFQARRAEALTPGVWLWRCFRGKAGGTPFLRVQDWQLELAGTNQPPSQGKSSTYTNVVDIGTTLEMTRRWLPAAELSNGVVRARKTSIQFPSLAWKNGELQAAVELPQQRQRGIVKASLKEMPFIAQVASETAHADATISLSAKQDGLALRGEGAWETNRFEWDAHFGRSGSLPQEASLRAAKFRLSGEVVRLPDYQNITGDLRAGWTNGSFTLDLAATGTPADTSTNVPPAEIRFQARGDTNAAVIEAGVIRLPWLQADISPGATLHFVGPFLREPANLSLRADLDKQRWVKVRGILQGKADLRPGDGQYPQAIVQLSGTNVGTAECEAKTFVIEGRLNWPLIEVTRGEATLDDGSYARLSAQGNAETKTIASGKLELSGPVGGRWLPAGYGYENALVNLEVAGPFTNLLHAAHVMITNVTVPQLKPLQVRLDWQGQDTRLSRTDLQISTSEATLAATFAAEIKHPDTNSPVKLHCDVALDKLEWKKAGEETFSLHKPARILVERLASATNAWRAEIADFQWSGKGGAIEINGKADWPEKGNLVLLVTNLQSQVLNSFTQQPVEQATIHEASGTLGWTNGPLVFDIAMSAEAVLRSKTNAPESKALDLGSVSTQLKARGDLSGVMITNFLIRSETSSVAVASGLLPVTFAPASPTNFIQLNTKKPVDFSLRTEPQSVFWQKLSEWTGVILREPELRADVSGTWERPQGRAQLRAAEIKLPAKKSDLPVMERLDLDLWLDYDVARLTNFTLLVQGQRVAVTGEIPLGEKFWTDLKQKKPPNWELATGRLQIAEAQISAFSGLFPALLAPQGTFHLDVSLTPGGKLDGQLALKDARTRPLPSVGPIRDIAVMMRFVGRTVKLGEVSATIGGSPISAAGEGDLSGTDWLKGIPPPFEFVLFGTNVPLSRQPESIIRSDLNLAIKKTNGAPPLISGNVRLRNSYYLSDLADLVPGKVSTAEKRPPYFSVDEPGLADWRLAVRVGGERGLKVRSTLFSGEVSPNLRLQGTLKEPLALGDVKIESGTIKFPFASLDAQRGYATLTSEDPYRPHLMVTAVSKKFGYDVRMEVTGPADEPIIQFSSTPPLSSEQLILMLTAGELPKGGYTLNPQQRAQTMALFLGKDLLSKLGFGDDSKERLTFSSGQEISETGKPTYSIEYKLTDRWSIVGEYDRFNAYNAGVKWKIYSK